MESSSSVGEGSGGGSGGGGDVIKEEESLPVLEAKYVYILMSKDHRISRNRRAEWFFSRFGSLVTLPKDTEISSVGESVDFHVVSAIPSSPPKEWSPKTRHSYSYRITTNTIVTYLSRRYRVVYCIDVSPSVSSVDVQAGTVVFDRIFHALRSSLDGLMRPFYIPGSTTIFQPKIFITVITHSPFVASVDDEVILQGKLLGPSTYGNILETVFQRLNFIENKMAEMTSALLQKLEEVKEGNASSNISLFDGDEDSPAPSKSSIALSSDFSLVDLLKQALIALSLLPENSSSGLVILTDGVVSVPDGRYLDIILSQLRYNTVSCSFIQLSSPFHPHLCHGALPYADLMRFIASATFGAFLTEAPEIMDSKIAEMNVYHQAFLAWSFQSSDTSQTDCGPPASAKPGEWSIRNKCFFTVRDMPIVKKQQYANPLAVDYMKALSCRLREGFMIKEISLTPDGQYRIVLTLPWKFLIHLEYVLITNKAPQSKVECILSLEGPYDFLHDVTCLAGRAFPSFYRQLMVNRFWATRKNLSESDRLLVHLNSFSSNPSFYNIPDSLRNGVPLFYFASNSTVPILQSSDFPYPQFAQFWKPVCMLDTTVWQKWMHTHRIGIILEHDHPLPKHLHFPNSTGRFHVILCRQAVMALNTLLKNMSSFVLVENHSYVTLMYSENDKKQPFSFYIIRVTSKPPYVVLRLAFLVGTPGNLRHQTVSTLREKITTLTFPQRLKEPPRWRFPNNLNPSTQEQSSKATWSNISCCIIMQKPIEKILIRYDKIPENFCKVLMSQHPSEDPDDQKSSVSKQSTFGFRPTHPNPLSGTTIMVPEMFNTVARYLHHRRWIWWFPKSVLPQLTLKDAADILSTVTKMRLQEGFRFAYSSAGTISMLMEVQMENKTCRPAHELSETISQSTIEETYYTPCVVQFVVFPPVTSLKGNFEGELEAFEDAKDLYFVTECWAEPQCGKISNCPFSLLNDLEYADVPKKIFEINEECFLTLGTFEYLRGISDYESVPDSKHTRKTSAHKKPEEHSSNSISILPFEFELKRVLPKCQQTEILFSMFFQDLSLAFSIEKGDQFLPFHERANEILHNSWNSNLLLIHEKEIKVDAKQYGDILQMVLSRDEDVPKSTTETKSRGPENVPAWRCFVRSVDSTQLLVTLMPKTLKDTKLLFLSMERSRCGKISPEVVEMQPLIPFPIPKHLLLDQETSGKKQRCRKTSEPNCGVKTSANIAANLALDLPCINGGRKRLRAFSGGENASALKKAFRVHSVFNEILTHSFHDENSSKYIVPKDNKPIIIKDFAKNEDSREIGSDSEVFSGLEPELQPELEPQLQPQTEPQLQPEPQLLLQPEPQLLLQTEPQLLLQSEPELPPQSEPQLPQQSEPQLPPQSEPQLPPQSEPQLSSQIEPQLPRKLEPQLPPQLEPQPEPQLPPQPEPQLPPQPEPQLPPQPEPQLPPQPEPQLPPQPEPQLPPQSEPQLPPQSEPQVPPQSEPQVPPQPEPQLPPQSEPELPPQSEPQVPPQPEPQVPPQPEPQVPPQPEPQVPPQSEPQVPPQPEPQVPPQPEPQVPPQPEPQLLPQPDQQLLPQPEPQLLPQPEPQVLPQPKPQLKPQQQPQPMTSNGEEQNEGVPKVVVDGPQPMFGSLTMPLFVYDCSLTSLRDNVIFKGSSEIIDACFDFRIFKVENDGEKSFYGEDEAESPTRSFDSGSQDSSKTNAPTPESSQAARISVEEYCKELQMAYKTSYIRSIYQSLQLGYYIGPEDLKAVMSLCHKDPIRIDLTEFLKCVCMHLNAPEKESCQDMDNIHLFIKRKFYDIISKDFNFVKADSNLYFFKCSPRPRTHDNSFSGVSTSDTNSDTDYVDSHGNPRPTEYYRLSESGQRRVSEDIERASAFPLFMYIRCTVSTSDIQQSTMVDELPVCIEHLDTTFVESILNSIDKAEDGWSVTLELIFLTAPRNDFGSSNTQMESDGCGEKWPSLPPNQMEAVKNAINEIQWLLDDEITSFRSKSDTLTPEILKDIASHVERSVGKLGCFQQSIPLKFVNNDQVKGTQNFIERFSNVLISGFSIKKMGEWWYLIGENDSSNDESYEPELEESEEVFCKEVSHADVDALMANVCDSSSSSSFPTESTRSSIIDVFSNSSYSSDTETEKVNSKKEHVLLPFWMIFRIEEDHVISYCHCRYNEDDLAPLERCTEMRQLMLNVIMSLLRVVNQDLLLQSLHHTRVCSPLLELDRNMKSLDEYYLHRSGSPDGEIQSESDIEGQDGHIIPGMFSCPVVWETTFMLHPRLGSGPGKSAFTRGIQILRSTLMALEVTNRENMFVYRNSIGNVFYLRLYRVYETLDDIENEIPPENPSPRSSVSAKSCVQEHADRHNREETMFGILKEPPTGPRDRISEGVVLIKVHGVTEAGSEIKDQLIQSLQNKLDDAVLDVLSVTLDRNPHCKLTPEDVHFIQRPNSAPDAVFKFTTGPCTKLLLPAFAFYLHQNLLQFLNTPKYTKQEAEYHFHDYFHPVETSILEEQNVYLYNQSPGGTGSRGVACVAAALVDRSGNLFQKVDWKRPADFAFSLGMDVLSTFIETEEITKGQSSDVMVELCVWKQGRINLDILKNNFYSAIKHGGWDLAMEYQVLTPSLSVEMKSLISENNVFMFREKRDSISSTINSIEAVYRSMRRRNSSVCPLNTQNQNYIPRERERSLSFTDRRNPLSVVEDPRSEWTLSSASAHPDIHGRGSTVSSETIRGLDFSSRRNTLDNYDRLHVNYATLLKRWCSLGTKMNVPSLRVMSVSLKPRHYLDETVTEVRKMISAIAPDNSTRQFWKLSKNVREFLAIGDNIYPEYRGVVNQVRREVSALKMNETKLQSLEKKDESDYPQELLRLFKTKEHFQPSSENNFCIMIARNSLHWATCVTKQNLVDPTFHIPEVMKSIYKFSPLMSESSGPSDDRSSFSLDKSRFRKNLLALREPCEDDTHAMLIPRQRFLMATISKTSIEYIFYNWSKESSDRLVDQTKLLAQWTKSRMQLLSSVLLQKSGLFYHQPFVRHSHEQEPNSPPFGGADMKDLVLSHTPIKSSVAPGSDRAPNGKGGASKTSSQLSDIYRNLHHSHLQNTYGDVFTSPIEVHGRQMLSLLNSGKREIENALFRYWLSRGPSASNVIGMEAIEAFKQAARTMHYCMTPIMFLPRWRSAVALTRDNTVGVFKRTRNADMENLVDPKGDGVRSRHPSEISEKTRHSSEASERTQNSSDVSERARNPSEFSERGRHPSEFSGRTQNSSEFSERARNPSEFSERGRHPSEFSGRTQNSSEFSGKTRHPSEASESGRHPSDISERGRNPSEVSGRGRHPSEVSGRGRHPSEVSERGRHPSEVSGRGRHPSEVSERGRHPSEVSGRGRNLSELSERGRHPSEVSGRGRNLSEFSERGRHPSEVSGKIIGSSKGPVVKSPIWSLYKRAYSSGVIDDDSLSGLYLPKSSRISDEAWHVVLCNSFMQEYMQYLQTLGFIPTHSNSSGVVKRKQPMLTSETWTASYVGRMERIRRMSDGSVLSASESEKSATLSLPMPSSKAPVQRVKLETSERVFYLQKSLPGGIILLEVGLVDPFFYCKIHMLEAHRIQQAKSFRRNSTSQNSLNFIDECDKMKVLMHLHSFAYDFHLRCIHSYICGKQLIFKQGYHITKFLDDFISYYCKGPNFARNTVHIGLLTMHNVSTPSHILFNYILSHDKTYQMKVLRMIPLHISKAAELLDPVQMNEYILVYNLSKKVVFKESEEENQYDEFDMSLLITHDSPSVRPYSSDPSVLRMKYYILLTSRRELYPKVVSDSHAGKVYPVTAPEPLSINLLRPNESSGHTTPARKIDVAGNSYVEPRNIDMASGLKDSHVNGKESGQNGNGTKGDVGPDGIREEKVLYLGYFSSHEQMMQQLVKQQTEWAENFIHTVVGRAAVDCRRDLLWQRLLVGGQMEEKLKGKKSDLTIRETVGVLTCWEFTELLELVQMQPLRFMDSKLQVLLTQPMSFFQTLIKLLTYGNQYQHRYFVSPEGLFHHLVIINPNINKSVVMVDLNLERQSCTLSLVSKERKDEIKTDVQEVKDDEMLDPEILSLIECAVGACCYCNWIHFL